MERAEHVAWRWGLEPLGSGLLAQLFLKWLEAEIWGVAEGGGALPAPPLLWVWELRAAQG